MMTKLRLDQLLVERGLAESRAKAQALVLAGQVFSGERRLDKPGQAVAAISRSACAHRPCPMSPAAASSSPTGSITSGSIPTGMVALDVGASTGGFTDVLLQRGAARVYAVDVGHGQLDWRLRNDPRVVVLEKTNARHLTRELIPEPVDLVVCDVELHLARAGPAGGACARRGRTPGWSR